MMTQNCKKQQKKNKQRQKGARGTETIVKGWQLNDFVVHLNITRKELSKLFLFATSHTHFIFNSKFYNQTNEIAIGSPLAPILANICMGFHELKWLNEYNFNKPKFYLRYADDILAAFDNEQDSLNF